MPLALLPLLAAAAAAPPPPAPTAPVPRPAAAPLAGKVVVLDPGHNGGNASHPAQINRTVDIGNGRKACDTTGTATARGYTEAAYTLAVSRLAARDLRALGARVILTRETNAGVGPCISERAAIANRAGADAAISVHADGGPPSGSGFHVILPGAIAGLTDDIAAPSRRLGLAVRSAYRRATGMPYATYLGRRGLDVRTDLGGLNLSDVPKVFIETGNMASPRDSALLGDAGFRRRVAGGIAAGIERFLAPSG